MVAVTVILSMTVPGSAVGRPVGGVSVGGTGAAGPCRVSSSGSWLLSLAASVGSRRRALVVHYLQNTHSASQRTSHSLLCRVRGRAGSVGVGYAGLSQMQTLVTRLGAELAGYGRIAAIHSMHYPAAPGAGGSQCAYGERTQEQAARSAGVRVPKVTVLRVVSGQAGLEQA